MDQTIDNNAVNPLASFYGAAGAAAPRLVALDAAALPVPYRDLLAHDRDMTSTLEAFFAQPMRLRVLQSRVDDGCLFREVVLIGTDDETPAEFGAIRILLNHLPDDAARRDVRAGQRPLGGILREHGIEHHCRPSVYFRVASDAVMRDAFGLTADDPLYGRQNRIFLAHDLLLAEVTEILPLLEAAADARP